MLHYTVGAIILAMTLAGCAGKPSKEAPIETLGAKPVSRVVPPPAVVAPPVAVAPPVVAPKVVMAEPVQTKKAKAEAGSTRPLRADEMQSRPLDAPVTPEVAKAEVVKAEVAKTEPTKNAVAASVRPKARTFQFEYDSAALAATDYAILEAHGGFLKMQANLELLVQGHADERGSREYNLALGQRRAESVKQALVLLGVPEARVEAVSLGSEKPLVEGHDEAAWKKNRRAVLIYKDE